MCIRDRHQTLWPRLEKEAGLKSVFHDIEMPLVPVLSRIERNGTYVDADMLKKQSTFLAKRMMELEEKAFEEAGQKFNLGSPKQLGEILYENWKSRSSRRPPKARRPPPKPCFRISRCRATRCRK